MALSRHQKMRRLIKGLIHDIDSFNSKVVQESNCVQLHFWEKCYVEGRPFISPRAFRAMGRSHYLGLRSLSSNSEVRKICASTNLLIAPPILRHFFFKRELYKAKEVGRYFPWGVRTIFPAEHALLIQRNSNRKFLQCLHKEELGCFPKWWKKDDAANSITHQLLSIKAYFYEQNRLKENLLQDPTPYYNEAVMEWKEDSECPDTVEKDIEEKLLEFAPENGQTVALAWEAMRLITRNRTAKNFTCFLACYRKKLEKRVFEGLTWDSNMQRVWIGEWERRLFKEPQKVIKAKEGRFKQSEVIDCDTAADFIRYFVDRCIADENDKKNGEVACILWLLIACSEQGVSYGVETEVFFLRRDHVLQNNKVRIGGHTVSVSRGLYMLLRCLFGKGAGSRDDYLFKNVRTIKSLERALKKASKQILGDEAILVLPSAFLALPHVLSGTRMPFAERKVMRGAREVLDPDYVTRPYVSAIKNIFQRRSVEHSLDS